MAVLVTSGLLQTAVAMGLATLRENIVMPKIVNRNYESEITGAKKNGTVNITIPAAISTVAVTPSHVPPGAAAATPTTVSLELTEWERAPFAMDDKQLIQVQNGLIPMQLAEAAKSLANTIDNFIWTKTKKFYSVSGIAGTTPFASDFDEYLQARKFANSRPNLMPMDPRYMIINPDAEANVLGLRGVQDASFAGTTDGIVNGQIGRKLGALWLMSQNVPFHTTGDAAVAAFAVNQGTTPTGYVAGYTGTIVVDTGTGEFVEGDIISFAGHSQTYAVLTATGATNTTGLTLEPALQADVADNELITKLGSHAMNVLIHRDAIGFAMAPLIETVQIPGLVQEAVAIDEESGLSLRLIVVRQHYQWEWSLDALWGATVIRSGHGVRVMGEAA